MTTETQQHGLLHRMALECLCGAFLYEDERGHIYCVDSHAQIEIPYRNHNKKRAS